MNLEPKLAPKVLEARARKKKKAAIKDFLTIPAFILGANIVAPPVFGILALMAVVALLFIGGGSASHGMEDAVEVVFLFPMAGAGIFINTAGAVTFIFIEKARRFIIIEILLVFLWCLYFSHLRAVY